MPLNSITDTTSLASSILRNREEWGRTYHKFRGGQNDYWGPNDDQQNDQLDIGHHMLTLLLGDRLYLAPIDEKSCRHVLDVGCGTGIWSLDFADAHPSAEVVRLSMSVCRVAQGSTLACAFISTATTDCNLRRFSSSTADCYTD